MCAQHRSARVLNVRPALALEGPNSLTLPNEQPPNERPLPDVLSPRTNHFARSRELQPVVPEVPLGTRVAGDPQAIRFPSAGPDLSGVSSLAPAVSTSMPECMSSAASAGGCANGTAAPLGEGPIHMLSVEAEPTPPTVPDPAEVKRGTCEVRVLLRGVHGPLLKGI